MSEQTAKPKAPSIYDGLECLVAEQLLGKKVTLTISGFKPCEITGESGRKASGFEVSFKETPKLVRFACKTSRRQLNEIFGTDNYEAYIGKRVTLYTAPTNRGHGIRFAKPEGN